jgi:hypothetical protein
VGNNSPRRRAAALPVENPQEDLEIRAVVMARQLKLVRLSQTAGQSRRVFMTTAAEWMFVLALVAPPLAVVMALLAMGISAFVRILQPVETRVHAHARRI